MDEIAKEAQFTKRTIYQYFLNKEDLFIAVRLKGRRLLFHYLEGAIEKEGTGLERIRQAAAAFHQFYRDNPDTLRLMNYPAKLRTDAETGPHKHELVQFGRHMFQVFAGVIEMGKADGSIRSNLDATMAAPAIGFVLTGFFHIFAESGSEFTRLTASRHRWWRLSITSPAIRSPTIASNDTPTGPVEL